MKDIELKAERAAFEAWWDSSEDIDNAGPWTPDSPIQFAWAAWRAAVEADRAQRVPERVTAEMWRKLAESQAELLRVHANVETIEDLLASTPAQPAQKPTTSVPWMTARRAAYFMERFLHEEKMLGPNEQDALRFTIEALEAMATTHQEPPQPVERKPMTDEVVRDGFASCGVGGINARLGFVEGVKFTERHYGIRE